MSHRNWVSMGILALTALAGCTHAHHPAQAALHPAPGSTTTGTVSFSERGSATTADVVLRGLAPGQVVTVTFHAGSCSQQSASSAVLASVKGDQLGHGHARGTVAFHGIKPIPFSHVADGHHVVVATSERAVIACGSIPEHD